jgi:hypothetical protein
MVMLFYRRANRCRCVRFAPGKKAAYVVQARNEKLAYYFEFFLEIGRRPIHGLTPLMPRWNPPKSPGTAIYHKIPAFSY